MLETVELRKVFKGKTAVEEVSLYLKEGESVGLIGPNGAGKSTTISMISSLLKPTAGDVRLNGQSVIKHPQQLRKVLGVVPQEIALYEELSSYENLKFFGKVYGLKGKELELKIQELLDMVGLRDRQKELIRTYSGGMKRRINIAVALMHDPKIVIMDEPTVGIDPQSRNHILDTVRHLSREKGTTVLYTSHYMEEVEQLCSRMYIMDHGRIIASGTKEELQLILSGEETLLLRLDRQHAEFTEELQTLAAVRQVEETELGLKLIVTKNHQILSRVVQAAERFDVQILNIHIDSPSLEDVFLHLTGRNLRD
ncbi:MULTISPECIES: ABC transporter ATP-binding protein [Paenibacillus]|uniref:ABC-2 type transport system ATP-binding protein n=1 Tax=Paenibacillus lactis TaxID=228574 RepID=A0ABS4FG78_9BACL|nr:ABC transporter ATP-binding protein [Paenibacillus lactis]MBP1895259.1 ABC-2 type transport system ATP-binding protein [Paenibacillus lactis]GIO93999.1 ABC transporter ATP-binding protein [Paenibacillus lactis]HAF97738.1 export ABC transporter ATP-binding protein [Paenibacillus lactis]